MGYLSRRSVCFGNFPVGQTKLALPFTVQPKFRIFLVNGNGNSCSISSNSSLIPVSGFRGHFSVTGTVLCKGQTRVGNELTSPEFCLPFAHLPNGKQPNTPWLFTICMGKPVGWRFGQMANEIHLKIQDWYTKFPSGLAFIICTNQSHLPKKWLRKPETNIKEGLKKWNANFRLEHSDRENRTIFSDVPFLSEISTGTTRKVGSHLLSNRIFRKLL